MKASGNSPLISPLEAIEAAGLSDDPQATLAQILSMQAAQAAMGGQAGATMEMPTEGQEEETGISETINEGNEKEAV